MAAGFLAQPDVAARRGDSTQVVVHIDARDLTGEGAPPDERLESPHVADGPGLHVETIRRLACDARLVPMVRGKQGRTIDVGRATRRIPPALRRALAHRDKDQCQHPGCNHRVGVQAHHVRWWRFGGKTKLDNLILLCPYHHWAVHELGFQITIGSDGAFSFARPDGTPIPVSPELPIAHPGDIRTLFPQDIPDDAIVPNWAGEPFDLDWITSVLLQPRRDRLARAA